MSKTQRSLQRGAEADRKQNTVTLSARNVGELKLKTDEYTNVIGHRGVSDTVSRFNRRWVEAISHMMTQEVIRLPILGPSDS